MRGCILFLWAITFAPLAARAEFLVTLTANVTPQNNGSYLYDYTLVNLTQSDLPAIVLNIETAPDANLRSITGPMGWDISYSPGGSSVSWAASDFQFAILPGTSADFTFLSQRPPAPGSFSIVGFDPATFSFGSSSGTIASPVATSVPEPSTVVLLALGAATIYVWNLMINN